MIACTSVYRGENPGGQYAHTAQALLGQQDPASCDLHADHRAAEEPTAPQSRHFSLCAGRYNRREYMVGLGVHL